MTTQPSSPPPHFIVIVPGYMGSKLRDKKTGDIVWIDVPSMLKNPLKIEASVRRMFETMKYPNDDLEPAGIIDQVVFVPPLFKQEQYGRLVDALVQFGYVLDPKETGPNVPAVYTFSYDWRQDNRKSARQLGEAIEYWRSRHPGAKAWLIAHSNGGIISRWYIEKEGGKEHVGRLFLMASPWDGAPKSLQVMLQGLQIMFLKYFSRFGISELTNELILSFPSYYQLLPYQNQFVHDLQNNSIDLFTDPSWLKTPAQRDMLSDAYKFNNDIGLDLSVETLCFFGNKKPTTTAGLLRTGAAGQWAGIEWDKTEAGDGTVPQYSAVHPNAKEKLPFVGGHGDIYVIPPVLEKLEWELVNKYKLGVLAEVTTSKLRIMFEPMRDAYNPGEKIDVWATVHDIEIDQPVFNAQVKVSTTLRDPLPGKETTSIQAKPSETLLDQSYSYPGRYEGSLDAPMVEGYYQLQAKVEVPGEAPIALEELVLVEND